MTELRVLITGFTKFSDFTSNPSQEILGEIAKNGINGLEIETLLLTVDEAGSKETPRRIQYGAQYSSIVHLGFSSKTDLIRIEKQGKNLLDMKIRDNSGRKINNRKIIDDSPGNLYSTANFSRISEALSDLSDKYVWSEDAGGFICNETYFRTLDAVGKICQNKCSVIFIHLPEFGKIDFETQLDFVSTVSKATNSDQTLH